MEGCGEDDLGGAEVGGEKAERGEDVAWLFSCGRDY